MVIITKVLNNETNYKSTKSIRGTAQCRPPEVVSAYQYLWSCHCHNREFLAQLLDFVSYISTNHRFAILKSDFIIAKILFFLLSKGLGLRFHIRIKKIRGTARCRPTGSCISVSIFVVSAKLRRSNRLGIHLAPHIPYIGQYKRHKHRHIAHHFESEQCGRAIADGER